MNPTIANAAQLLGRVLLAYIFIRGGQNKFGIHDAFVANLTKNGVPLPMLTYWPVVALEFFGGLAIATGFKTRLTAILLAAYCIATAVVVHLHPDVDAQMTNFYKNLAMCGGFLQLYALGAGGWSLDAMFGSRR